MIIYQVWKEKTDWMKMTRDSAMADTKEEREYVAR
jgi:hypothetical protein